VDAPVVAVHNPVSGLGATRDRLDGLRRICDDLELTLEVIATQGPGDGRRAAAEAAARRPRAIALVGGDGSLGELASAYADLAPAGRPPLLLVPAGRGNSFYKAVLADAPWEGCVRAALERIAAPGTSSPDASSPDASSPKRPAPRLVDAALVAETGQAFTLGFSLGYLRDCLDATRFFPALRGRALYAAAGTYAATKPRAFRVEVSVDGKPVYAGRSVMTAVGGGPYRGGRLHLFPAADLGDGLLDVVIVEAMGVRRFADVLRAAGSGAHVDLPEVHAFQGAEIAMVAPEPRAELDGTPWMPPGDTVTLRCLPGLLPLAAPASAPAPSRTSAP
jgi:diacylglycerol kinase (ATP)